MTEQFSELYTWTTVTIIYKLNDLNKKFWHLILCCQLGSVDPTCFKYLFNFIQSTILSYSRASGQDSILSFHKSYLVSYRIDIFLLHLEVVVLLLLQHLSPFARQKVLDPWRFLDFLHACWSTWATCWMHGRNQTFLLAKTSARMHHLFDNVDLQKNTGKYNSFTGSWLYIL